MADRVITVPQATQIAQATKRQLTELNERLTQLSFDLGTDENGNVILVRSDLEDLSEVSF